jgi:hypothetical protein
MTRNTVEVVKDAKGRSYHAYVRRCDDGLVIMVDKDLVDILGDDPNKFLDIEEKHARDDSRSRNVEPIDIDKISIWPTITREGDRYIRHPAPPGLWASFDTMRFVRDDRGHAWQVFEVEGKLWKRPSNL